MHKIIVLAASAALLVAAYTIPTSLVYGDPLPTTPGDGSAGGGHSPHPPDDLVSSGLPGFSPEVRIPLQSLSTVTKVLIRDFNNDGHADIMAEDRYGLGGLYLLIGDGHGNFETPAPLPHAGMDPNNMDAGDFNGDGALDVAVTNVLIDTVTIYLNDGSGNFARQIPDIAVASLPEGIVAVNVTAGPALDLVIASRAGKIQILVGSDDPAHLGTFVLDPSLDHSTGGTPISIAVADFDGDSKSDVCVANLSLNAVNVLLGDGTGHFSEMAGSPIPVGMGPHTPIAVDKNGDGHPDIIVGTWADSVVSVLLWNDGHFDRTDFPAGPGPVGVALCDFEGDGRKSLIATNYNTEASPAGTLAFLNGTASGGFDPAVFDDAGYGGISIAVGDLDEDGDQDFVVGFGNSSYLGLYFHGGAPPPPPTPDPIALPFEETFSVDAGPSGIAGAYPAWVVTNVSGVGTREVTGGNLVLTPGGSSNPQMKATVNATELTGAYTVEAELGGGPGTPWFYNIGLIVGGNCVTFHPGYAGSALRVDGPGGFGNVDVGFTVAEGVIHTLRVDYDGVSLFRGTLIDGENPANVYVFWWTNPAPVDTIGFQRQSESGVTGIFSRLSVSALTVPSPGELAVPTSPTQYHCDGVTVVPAGGSTSEQEIRLQAVVSSSNLFDSVRLEVQLVSIEVGGPAPEFSSAVSQFGGFVASGGTSSVHVTGLTTVGSTWVWRARTVTSDSRASEWLVVDGSPANSFAFTIVAPTSPAVPTALQQRMSDNSVPIDIGMATPEIEVYLSAILTTGQSGRLLHLEVDLVRVGVPPPPGGGYDGPGAGDGAPGGDGGGHESGSTGDSGVSEGSMDGVADGCEPGEDSRFTSAIRFTSGEVASGGRAAAHVTGLLDNSNYIWRARTVDSTGEASDWVVLDGDATSTYAFAVRSFLPLPSFTPAGEGVAPVEVAPVDKTTGEQPAVIHFDDITDGGGTTVESASTGPAAPEGFLVGVDDTTPYWYEIHTTAEFAGFVTITITWLEGQFEHEEQVKLFHYVSGAWVDATVSVDTEHNTVTGQVTSFSLFAIFEANSPPVADAGADRFVEATNDSGASVHLNGSLSADPEGDALSYAWTWDGGSATGATPDVALSIGAHVLTLTVTDGRGQTAVDTVTLTVRDTTAPAITSLSATPATLTTPNHKMVAVTLTGTATDAVDATPALHILSITSNEPTTGCDDDDVAVDWAVTGAMTLNLRAERSGKGSGRIYTITVQATDASGNSSVKTVTVTVPKGSDKDDEKDGKDDRDEKGKKDDGKEKSKEKDEKKDDKEKGGKK